MERTKGSENGEKKDRNETIEMKKIRKRRTAR